MHRTGVWDNSEDETIPEGWPTCRNTWGRGDLLMLLAAIDMNFVGSACGTGKQLLLSANELAYVE